MIFPYQGCLTTPSPVEPGVILYRPIVPIWIKGQTKGREVKALVDTGATVTVFPMRLCTEGLIDPAFIDGEEELLEAANGTIFLVRYATVGLRFVLKDRVHAWDAKIGFSDDRDEAVLGDVGFLRYFKALFDRRRLILAIELSGGLPLD